MADSTQGFRDRDEAGRRLGAELAAESWSAPTVLGLVRGGVPVAAGVADVLDAAMDILIARKIGAPHQPELGIGAISESGEAIYDESAVNALGISHDDLHATRERELARAQELAELRPGEPLAVSGRDVIVVDDGVATGVTSLMAVRSLRAQEPAKVVFAAPVGARQAVEMLAREADDVRVLLVPSAFHAVGEWYRDFHQVSDDDVRDLLTSTNTTTREHR